MLTGRTVGLTALALGALAVGALFAVAVPAAIDGIVPPQPMPVEKEMRREHVLKRGMQDCIAAGGRAMHDKSGIFIGCDRMPGDTIIVVRGRRDADTGTRISSSSR